MSEGSDWLHFARPASASNYGSGCRLGRRWRCGPGGAARPRQEFCPSPNGRITKLCIRHIRQLRPHLSKRLVLDQILEPVNFARSGLMYVENVNGSLIFRTRPQPGHPSNFLMPLMILSG